MDDERIEVMLVEIEKEIQKELDGRVTTDYLPFEENEPQVYKIRWEGLHEEKSLSQEQVVSRICLEKISDHLNIAYQFVASFREWQRRQIAFRKRPHNRNNNNLPYSEKKMRAEAVRFEI